MPRIRKQGRRTVDDRAWSAPTNVDPRASSTELAHYSPLPAETGPIWAPDKLSVWPVEGGRYGLDAHYYGATGVERARGQQLRLGKLGLSASVREADGDAVVRLGPLAHDAAWVALEGFLGRPLREATG